MRLVNSGEWPVGKGKSHCVVSGKARDHREDSEEDRRSWRKRVDDRLKWAGG